MVAVFYFVPISSVFSAISIADPLWVAAGIILQILIRVLNSFKMQTIARAQGLNTGYLTMIRIVFTTTFYNIVSPGALAGGAVTFLKYRQQGVKSVAAVANIYANKSVEIMVVAFSAPLFWLVDQQYSSFLILIYVIIMVIGFYGAFSLFFGRFGNIQWLAVKINNHGQSVIHRKLAAFCEQVMQIGQIPIRTMIYLTAYSALFFLFAALAIICFGNALGFKIGLVPILWIYPVIYLLGLLPISISNIGVREVSMIMLLAPYGIVSTDATAWSLLMYSGPLSCALIGLILEAEQFWLRKENRRTPVTESQQKTEGGANDDKSS